VIHWPEFLATDLEVRIRFPALAIVLSLIHTQQFSTVSGLLWLHECPLLPCSHTCLLATVSQFTSYSAGYSARTQLTPRLAAIPHRHPNLLHGCLNTLLKSRLVLLITPPHGPCREHRFQQFLYCIVQCVTVWPFPSNCHCLQNRYIATAVVNLLISRVLLSSRSACHSRYRTYVQRQCDDSAGQIGYASALGGPLLL
jgi:hypothetical protein